MEAVITNCKGKKLIIFICDGEIVDCFEVEKIDLKNHKTIKGGKNEGRN